MKRNGGPLQGSLTRDLHVGQQLQGDRLVGRKVSHVPFRPQNLWEKPWKLFSLHVETKVLSVLQHLPLEANLEPPPLEALSGIRAHSCFSRGHCPNWDPICPLQIQEA